MSTGEHQSVSYTPAEVDRLMRDWQNHLEFNRQAHQDTKERLTEVAIQGAQNSRAIDGIRKSVDGQGEQIAALAEYVAPIRDVADDLGRIAPDLIQREASRRSWRTVWTEVRSALLGMGAIAAAITAVVVLVRAFGWWPQ